jgi:hypothetical protein
MMDNPEVGCHECWLIFTNAPALKALVIRRIAPKGAHISEITATVYYKN